MDESNAESFVEALLRAPAGVALLARLEADQMGTGRFDSPAESTATTVSAAAVAASTCSFGELVAAVVEAAEMLAGPWSAGAPDSVAHAYRFAPDRRPIAEAIAERHGARLHAPIDLASQELWHSNTPRSSWSGRRLFVDFDDVYGNGEFTWNGLWSVTAPPPEAHDALVSIWEVFPGPVSRWHLPVAGDARVWEIHRPTDWAHLVEAHPKRAPDLHSGWELPGPNQRADELDGLLALPGQNAARSSISSHLVPDWASVAGAYDAVHLSWAGFITTEGFVSDAGTVTMLRYWGSERTLWLANLFGEPEPMDAPNLSGRINGDLGVDVRVDLPRARRDLEVIRSLLGR